MVENNLNLRPVPIDMSKIKQVTNRIFRDYLSNEPWSCNKQNLFVILDIRSVRDRDIRVNFFAHCKCQTECIYKGEDPKTGLRKCNLGERDLAIAQNADPEVINPGVLGDFGGHPDPLLMPRFQRPRTE